MLKIDEETRQMWARRARKERIRAFFEGVGTFIAIALFAILAWLFLAATPSQKSAECDAVAEQLEAR